VSTDKDHVSLPHLYGAPAHRPRRTATDPTAAPLAPDDLPIENLRSAEDAALARDLFPRSYTSHVMDAGVRPFRTPVSAGRRPPTLTGRPLLLRALAGRLMRPKGH
jgi:hypothetical protein